MTICSTTLVLDQSTRSGLQYCSAAASALSRYNSNPSVCSSLLIKICLTDPAGIEADSSERQTSNFHLDQSKLYRKQLNDTHAVKCHLSSPAVHHFTAADSTDQTKAQKGEQYVWHVFLASTHTFVNFVTFSY